VRSAVVAALLAVLVASLATGCAEITGTPPAAAPADFPGLAAGLSRRGIVIDQIVAGDAGCDDPALVPTAIRFDASGLDQAVPTRVYVYIFRNREAFERLLPDVASCASRYVTDEEGEPWVPVSPFVMTGPGPWSPAFREALTKGLEEAAGTGG
jgi:hypothetical protein